LRWPGSSSRRAFGRGEGHLSSDAGGPEQHPAARQMMGIYGQGRGQVDAAIGLSAGRSRRQPGVAAFHVNRLCFASARAIVGEPRCAREAWRSIRIIRWLTQPRAGAAGNRRRCGKLAEHFAKPSPFGRSSSDVAETGERCQQLGEESADAAGAGSSAG